MSIPLVFQPHETANRHFFAVTERTLYTLSNKGQYCEMPEHKAIINASSGVALSIVRTNFLIVSHQSAFQIGCKIFKELFDVSPMIGSQKCTQSGISFTVELISEEVRVRINSDGFKLEGVQNWRDFLPQPKNRSEALLWNDDGLIQPLMDRRRVSHFNEPSNEDIEQLRRNLVPNHFEDYYHPFVRIHNHLREQASFTVEMGYYRSRCSNGVMFGSRNAMTFKTNYHSIKNTTELELDAVQYFTRRKSSMFNVIGDLFRTLAIPVAKADMHLITLSVFKEKFLAMDKQTRKAEYDLLLQIAAQYSDEIGCNMNAAMNVATEYSQRLYSHGRVVSGIQNMPSVLLRKMGAGGIRAESLLRRIRSEEKYILNHEGIQNIDTWLED